jgi:hypothetical protein
MDISLINDRSHYFGNWIWISANVYNRPGFFALIKTSIEKGFHAGVSLALVL